MFNLMKFEQITTKTFVFIGNRNFDVSVRLFHDTDQFY